MKTLFTFTAALTLLVGNLRAGDIGSMMKQKARGFDGRDTTQPAPIASQPAIPATPPPPPLQKLPPQQQALANLVNDLGSVQAPVTPEAVNKLAADLAASALGVTKPSAPTVRKLANDLAAAVADKTITPAQRSRMAQDLQAILAGANVPQSQMGAIIGDVPVILKKAGVDTKQAAAVDADLKAIAAEVKPKATK